jgi:hypothetical protein
METYNRCLQNIIILYILAILTLLVGCSGELNPEITLGVDSCEQCNMVINTNNQACGYYSDSEFIPFDSPGCLLYSYEEIKKQAQVIPSKIYFADYITARLLLADSISFLLTDHIHTVMSAGVLCFADKDSAENYKRFPDETITDWTGYQVLRGTPDKIIEAIISPQGIKPEVVSLNKNEIVEWIFQGQGMQNDIHFKLKGYEELGEIVIPTDGEKVKLRMLANHPGAGFPFINSKDESIIGMVKVSGAHTHDEEVQ